MNKYTNILITLEVIKQLNCKNENQHNMLPLIIKVVNSSQNLNVRKMNIDRFVYNYLFEKGYLK